MDVSVKTKAALRVACARATGPYTTSSKEAWVKLIAWAGPRELFVEGALCLGMGHDTPSLTPASMLRYDACVTVGPEVVAEGETTIGEIPGGEYAVLLHKGPYEGLEASYRHIYQEWLPKSGRRAALLPPYEVYVNTPETTAPEELLTEINVLLAPLDAE